MEDLEKSINQLENNIWITRKCRINAAERLQGNENFFRFISIWYSIATTTCALINLFWLHDSVLDVATLIFSIATTDFFLYLDAKNYKDRYLSFKDNYISLNVLLAKIKRCKIDGIKAQDFTDISKEYNELLAKVENHKQKDLIKLMVDEKLENAPTIAKRQIGEYYCEKVLVAVARVVAVLVPILCAMGYCFYKF